MDVQMPELDGFETTAAIREREQGTPRHVPIVALTAHAMKGDAERCLASGMDAYLAKPLQAADLVAAIARLAPDGVIDEARLLERVGGDRRALSEVARIFLADAPRRTAEIRRAIAKGDARALRAAAHTLKGAVSNFGAQGAVEAAFDLQKLGDSGQLDEAPSALERLEAEMKAVRSELRRLVQGKSEKDEAAAQDREGGGAGETDRGAETEVGNGLRNETERTEDGPGFSGLDFRGAERPPCPRWNPPERPRLWVRPPANPSTL